MKLKNILQIAVLLFFASTAIAADKSVLHIEIRLLKSAQFDLDNYLAFGTDNKIEFDSLSSKKATQDGEYIFFQNSYDLLAKDRRHAIIIYINREPRDQPNEVFLLSIPRKLKPMDWTNWQRPNYVETNAVSNFSDNYTPADRSTNVPPNSFELRFKIESPK